VPLAQLVLMEQQEPPELAQPEFKDQQVPQVLMAPLVPQEQQELV